MVSLMILSAEATVAHGPLSARRLPGACLAAFGILLACGCNRQLPAAPTPQPLAPQVAPAAPLAEGEGQLVIDVVDGPTQVQRIRMQPNAVTDDQGKTRYEFVEAAETLCDQTPCVVNLPLGNVVLGFPVAGNPTAMEVELVHIESEATVYRRALTFHEPGKGGSARTLGILATTFGGMTMVAGAALLPVGLATDSGGLTLSGAISLGAGGVLTALGIWSVAGTGSTYRPGSAIHFSF
jgi:hypothetical protein